MVSSKLGILYAFVTCNIFNLGWVYWDITPIISQRRYVVCLFYLVDTVKGIVDYVTFFQKTQNLISK